MSRVHVGTRIVNGLLRQGYRLGRLFWHLTRPITVGVRAVLIQDGSVLLVWHTYRDLWHLPGGGVKRGETLEQAIRREAAEEAGAALGELVLLGMYDSFIEGKSDHVAVFVCTDFVLCGEPDREIARLGFFDPQGLPEDVSPGTRRRLREYVQGETPYVRPW